MTEPSAAKALIKKLEGAIPSWSVKVTHATGRLEFGGLSEETDGEGKRHRVSVPEDVDSCLVQARHVDGRAFVALWVHRHGQCTAAGGKKWKLDLAWRGRRPGEWTPKQITATELKAYVEPVLAMERAA